MPTPLIIRLGAITASGLMVAGNMDWFSHYLPIAGGSPAAEAVVVVGASVVLQELVDAAREIARALCAWWQRRRSPRRGSP